MTIIINLYVIISALFLVSGHTPSLADKLIITSYIILIMWMCIIIGAIISRGRNIIFTTDTLFEFVMPVGLTILYFLNGFTLVFFPNMRFF